MVDTLSGVKTTASIERNLEFVSPHAVYKISMIILLIVYEVYLQLIFKEGTYTIYDRIRLNTLVYIN